MEAFQFCDMPYPRVILQTLFDMQQSNTMCDITLVAENDEINVHKLILSAISPYFRILENSKFKENLENKIEFPDIKINTLKIIVQFIYTGEIKICDSNVFELMTAFHLFQISILKLPISHFLIASLNSSNCLEILAYAKLYDYEELFVETTKYVNENFHFVVTKDTFVHTPSYIVKHVLCQRNLNLNDIFRALEKWLKHNMKINDVFCNSDKVMNNIDSLFIIKDKYPQYSDLIISITDFITENYVVNHNLSVNENSFKEMQIILCIGGSSRDTIWPNVESYYLNCWSLSLPSPSGPDIISKVIPAMDKPRMCFAVAQSLNNDNLAYVFGGLSTAVTEPALKSCECYDICTNLWTGICPMPVALKKMAAVWFNRRIFVIGGNEEDKTSGDVWEYSEKDNRWVQGIPILEARSNHSACNVRGILYVLGGQNSRKDVLSSVERFNIDLQSWSLVSDMPEKKCKFGCVGIDEFIYVIGGADSYYVLNSVHRYNTLTDKWEKCTNMPVPKCSFGCTVSNEKIYCIGGSDTVHGALSSVEVYNPNTNRWHYASDKLHTERAYSSAVTINIIVNDNNKK